MKKGIIVSFEGVDTSGKTTQVSILEKRLNKEGHRAVSLHFPMYERPIGAFIKKILNDEHDVDSEAMQMLYVADQMDQQETIKKYVDLGYIVLLDRYDISTVVYHSIKEGACIGHSTDLVHNFWQKELIRPDKTIILNLDPEEIYRRKDELDVFESDKLMMGRVSSEYRSIPRMIDDREIYSIEATKDRDILAETIWSVLGCETWLKL